MKEKHADLLIKNGYIVTMDAGRNVFTNGFVAVQDGKVAATGTMEDCTYQGAEELDAKPGWTFLTGEKDTVNDLLKALEVYAPNIWDHPPTVFVVDGRRGVWTRLYGFPSPDKIVEVLDRYRAARGER